LPQVRKFPGTKFFKVKRFYFESAKMEDTRGVKFVISTLFFHIEKGKCTENLLVASRKDSFKLRPEAATRSDILSLLGQGNLIFIRQGNVREF